MTPEKSRQVAGRSNAQRMRKSWIVVIYRADVVDVFAAVELIHRGRLKPACRALTPRLFLVVRVGAEDCLDAAARHGFRLRALAVRRGRSASSPVRRRGAAARPVARPPQRSGRFPSSWDAGPSSASAPGASSEPPISPSAFNKVNGIADASKQVAMRTRAPLANQQQRAAPPSSSCWHERGCRSRARGEVQKVCKASLLRVEPGIGDGRSFADSTSPHSAC